MLDIALPREWFILLSDNGLVVGKLGRKVAMPVIPSTVDQRSAEFQANRAAMAALVADLKARQAAAAQGGSEAARARHVARGKLLARERIEALLDPGAPFLEFSPLAAHGLYGDDAPGAGIVTGIGRVSGPRVRHRRQRRHGQGRHLLPR